MESDTPVYVGGATPASMSARKQAFVGWVRAVLSPPAMIAFTLANHPGYAVRLRWRAGPGALLFTAGSPGAKAQSRVAQLPGGSSARILGPPVTTSALSDGDALALLLVGLAASGLLGVLIVLAPVSLPAAEATTEPQPQPEGGTREGLYDTLTGLPNRPLTLDLAQRMLARAGRHHGMIASAVLIDIDWFKDVNDKLGEAVGDQALRVIAERLQEAVRAGDTVGRLEGDRFVALVESQARGVRLESLAGRIIEALHEPLGLEGFGPSFCLTASIGIALGRYTDADEMLRDAERAVDASKAAGKDRFTLFNANLRSLVEDRGVLEAEMSAALAEGQLFLLYEPIYSLEDRRVAGLEAVLRWRHPTRGVLRSEDFMPVAEETGLSVPIGRWALEEACTRAAAWNVTDEGAGVSVPVSAAQLHRDNFAVDVRRALQRSGIEPPLLTLQIAEATAMDDIEAVAKRLGEVKRLGVGVGIDSFGDAYARRSDLQQLPLDCLRVDRGALAASQDEDYRAWLLEAVVLFAREVSLTVIAKSLTTEEQIATLARLGCELGQGPVLHGPVPVDSVPRLLAGEPAEQTPIGETPAEEPTPASGPGAVDSGEPDVPGPMGGA